MMLEPIKNIKISGRFLFKNASKVAKDVSEIEAPKETPKEEFKIPEQKPDVVFKKFSLDNDPPYVPSIDSTGKNINYLA